MSQIEVLMLAFPGMDTLDFTGPLETLSQPNRLSGRSLFALTITASKKHTTTAQECAIERHISIIDAKKQLKHFDVLVVPGGRWELVCEHAKNDEEGGLVRDFVALGGKRKNFVTKYKDGKEEVEEEKHFGIDVATERVIMSVCTGAFFLAEAGACAGMTATTHHASLLFLRAFCEKKEREQSYAATEIVRAKFVDAGIREANQLRVITAGPISSGIDASLYLVEMFCGRKMAEDVANILGYIWRRDEGLIVD